MLKTDTSVFCSKCNYPPSFDVPTPRGVYRYNSPLVKVADNQYVHDKCPTEVILGA